MIKFIPIVVVLLLSSQSSAQQSSNPDTTTPKKCSPDNPFLCFVKPSNLPWPAPPRNNEIASERFPDLKTLEKFDQQFTKQKELWK